MLTDQSWSSVYSLITRLSLLVRTRIVILNRGKRMSASIIVNQWGCWKVKLVTFVVFQINPKMWKRGKKIPVEPMKDLLSQAQVTAFTVWILTYWMFIISWSKRNQFNIVIKEFFLLYKNWKLVASYFNKALKFPYPLLFF